MDYSQYRKELDSLKAGVSVGEFEENIRTLARLTALLAQLQLFALEKPASPTVGASILKHGFKVVSATGVTEPLARATPCLWVHVHAFTTNGGNVFVGGAGVNSTYKGTVLTAGNSINLAIDNLAKVSIAVSVAGEGVDYLYTQHGEEKTVEG